MFVSKIEIKVLKEFVFSHFSFHQSFLISSLISRFPCMGGAGGVQKK